MCTACGYRHNPRGWCRARARAVEALLESDALTPDSEGTPERYTVEADNVEYLVDIVLRTVSPAQVSTPVDTEETSWDGIEYALIRRVGYVAAADVVRLLKSMGVWPS